MSKGSGYSSFSHSQHSRQSSEGDSGHTRYVWALTIDIRVLFFFCLLNPQFIYFLLNIVLVRSVPITMQLCFSFKNFSYFENLISLPVEESVASSADIYADL